ncbi:hypothetical protein K439DRAFT_1665652, partial [Ramaria rubella]
MTAAPRVQGTCGMHIHRQPSLAYPPLHFSSPLFAFARLPAALSLANSLPHATQSNYGILSQCRNRRHGG